jgi:hypothetical protein
VSQPVLILCPTYAGKAYALDRYMASVDALHYPPGFRLVMLDNTRDDGGAYLRRLQSLAEDRPWMTVERVEPSDTLDDTLGACWGRAVRLALTGGFQWAMSLEQDVILTDPNSLDAIMALVERENLRRLTVVHPVRPSAMVTDEGQGEYGCMVADTRLWVDMIRQTRPDEVPRQTMDRLAPQSAYVFDWLPIEHLDDPNEGWPFAGRDHRRAA